MHQVRAIVLDWDNTIVDSFDHLVRFHQHVGEQLGWPPVTEEQIHAVWGLPFEDLIQTLWPDYDSQIFDREYRNYVLQQQVPEIAGAVSAIQQLTASFPIGILTAAPRYEVEHFMTQLGLDTT